MDFLDLLPTILGGGIIVVVVMALLWRLAQALLPSSPGRIVGSREIILFRVGGVIERMKGLLVETNLFLNMEIAGAVKNHLLDTYDSRIKTLEGKSGDATSLKTLREELKGQDMAKLCRVYTLREGAQKHIILQHTYIDRDLDAYGGFEKESKFTFGLSFLSRGVITGDGGTEPGEVDLPNLGRCKVHYIKPHVKISSLLVEILGTIKVSVKSGDEAKWKMGIDKLEALLKEERTPVPECLKTIALLVPASLELTEQLKSKDEQLRDKDRKMIEMGHELSAAAAERDAYRTTLKKLGVTDPDKVIDQKRRLDVLGFALMVVPALVGYYLSASLDAPPIAGVFIGFLGGAGLLEFVRR